MAGEKSRDAFKEKVIAARRASDRSREELLEARRQIAALRASRDQLKQRVEDATGQNAELRQRLERRAQLHEALSQRMQRCREQLHAPHSRQLPADALRTLLPLRAAAPPFSKEERAMAASREDAFGLASAAYKAAVAAAERPAPALGRVTINGLGWWVPVDERMPQRLERAEAQGFPLRAILQTRQVPLGGVMLDLGGNIGRTSIIRALLGDVRAVYAAEPEPGNYACLVRNVVEHNLRGFVMPDNVAIGATRGEVTLRRSRFIGGHRVIAATSAAGASVTVPSWPVDDWMEHLGIEREAVSFVKVDTQGSEVNVLRGAGRLLARSGVTWQMEVDPQLLRRANTSGEELLALLARHFTHFIDLSTGHSGSTRLLGEALAYVGTTQNKTDVLVFNAGAAS